MRGPPRPPAREGAVVLHPPASRGQGAVDRTFCKVLPGPPLPDSTPGLQIPIPNTRPLQRGAASSQRRLSGSCGTAGSQLSPSCSPCSSGACLGKGVNSPVWRCWPFPTAQVCWLQPQRVPEPAKEKRRDRAFLLWSFQLAGL